MTKAVTIFLFCCTIISCTHRQAPISIKGITIDPTIKREADKHIADSREFDAFKGRMQVYFNSGYIESHQNDSLLFSSDMKGANIPFKSFYLWHHDTLTIDGAFGIWGGTGFAIDIYQNEAVLTHMLSSDDFATLAYTDYGALLSRLEVPCTATKIVLSEIPDSTKNQVIYGYVEFKSNNFYEAKETEEAGTNGPRQKLRNNMKLYFRSARLNL